jgi:hypothetical protein
MQAFSSVFENSTAIVSGSQDAVDRFGCRDVLNIDFDESILICNATGERFVGILGQINEILRADHSRP